MRPVIKTPFDLLKHLAVWQLQVSNKKSKGGPNGERKELAFYIPMQEYFHLTNGQIGNAMSVNSFVTTVGFFLSIYFADKLPRRYTMSFSLIATGLLGVYLTTMPGYWGIVVAAPLGSYLGATVGWRGAFLCLVPIAVVAFIWQCISLPSMDANKSHTSCGAVFRLFSRRMVVVGMIACGLFFMGQFALFTYVRPFLESVTRVNSLGLSSILLIIGVAGFIGTLVVSAFLNRKFYPTLMAIPGLMAVIAIGLMLTGHHVWTVSLLLGLWGMLATAAPTGWWTWIARTLQTGGFSIPRTTQEEICEF